MPVPVPPLDQQRALHGWVDSRNRTNEIVVERLVKQIALLQERRQALITAAVTGELEIPGVAA